VVQALRKHPNVNAAWDNGRIIRRKALNLGIAVALEDGLVVPVLKHADERNIVGLARAINDLATRAQTNRLQPDDVTGGTFTVNNPGTLGSMFSTPIIVQPQAAILSMEAIVKRPVVIDDAIAIRPMMNLSLSIDHRILDGLAATRFLADVKRGLEEFPVEDSVY
jgi:2-oxoisovalerate dehydrogenase E2 component (dihydrolipoyl transacylase)